MTSSSIAARLVSVAAATLPALTRARYREQWMADLRDADEAGVQRSGIVLGAFSFATAFVTRHLMGTEIRASRSWLQLAIGLAVLVLPLWFGFVSSGLLNGTTVVLRDNLDVYFEFMNSPITVLFPVLVVFLSCLRLFQELGHRFASNTLVRVRVESYVFAKLLVASGTSFLVFFLFAFVPFVIAFYLWPLSGNPSVDPSVYMMTTQSAIADSFQRATFTSLLEQGPMVFGVVYSLWVAFGASVYTGLGMAALLLVKNRALALALPFVLFFGETAAAQIAGHPYASLLFSLFPFGYQQAPLLVGMAPTLVLAALVAVVWVFIMRRVQFLESLA
jgi:hypothetical protein